VTNKNQPGEFASSACYQHEFDSLVPGENAAWDAVRAWRVTTRAALVGYRNSLTDAQRRASADVIMQRLRETELLGPNERIGFYWPMPGEIDLRPLMSTLVETGVVVALPVITAKDQPLEFWRWRPDEALSESGPWGIPAPARRDLVDVSVLLVPMLGFDEQGHRLGHGGGYYDRTLAHLDPRPAAVGVAYSASRLRSIYPQAHDIPMDQIVTDGAS
jgi:5-formyltetrahydrofolate cyclo-ligase